jgi:hypothetical protein
MPAASMKTVGNARRDRTESIKEKDFKKPGLVVLNII